MNTIIRWYSQYRKKIWRIIGVFAIVIIVVQMMQWISVQGLKRKTGSTIDIGKNEEIDINESTLVNDKSSVTGEKITKSQKNIVETIDEFIEYCNNKQISEAYNLLSEDCKNEMYPTVNVFEELYFNKIFFGKTKNISAENWVGNIYKIKFIENALATGGNNTGEAMQDYITGEQDEEGNIRLNINGYIGKEEINQQTENYGIKIKVSEKHKYMNFETYVFQITNKTDNTILLNSRDSLEAMYLEDKNNTKYTAYIHELSEAELKLIPGETKNVSIKYYNKHGSSKKIENIIFSKIILNYNFYSSMENNEYYNDYGKIQIKL